MKLKSGQSPLMLIVEIFSVLTGLAFVLSAFMGSLMFGAAYRLNYFMIASPSDVLMGGFVTLGATATWAGLFTLLTLATPEVNLGMARGICKILRLYRRFDELENTSQGWFAGLINGVAFFFVISLLLVISTLKNERIPQYFQSGLRVAGADAPPACHGGAVEWLGSNAAIVRCGDGVLVIREPAKITMEPRGSD